MNTDIANLVNEDQEETRFREVRGTQAAYLPAKRGVNAFQLTMMIYFFTCGTYSRTTNSVRNSTTRWLIRILIS